MGALGYGSYDNDSAMDFVGTIAKGLVLELREARGCRSWEVVRAIIQLLIDNREFTASMDDKEIREIITTLQTIPENWIRRWDNPEAVRDSIAEQVICLQGCFLNSRQWAETWSNLLDK